METKRPKHIQYLINQITRTLGLIFISETEKEGNLCFVNSSELRDDYKTSFTQIDILDYCFAILYSSTYNEAYKDYLKIDFSRIPYPINTEAFFELVKLGRELRQRHLFENNTLTRLEVSNYKKIITELTE